MANVLRPAPQRLLAEKGKWTNCVFYHFGPKCNTPLTKDRHNNIPTSFPTKFCTHQKATPPSHRYPSCATILMLLYRWYSQQETPSLASVMKQPKESTHVLSKYLTVTACAVGGFVWPSELPTMFGWSLKISPISQFYTLLYSSQTLIILPARWCYSDGLHLYFGRRRIEPEPADRLFWPCFALFSSVSPGQDCFFSKIFNPFITSQDTHEIPYYSPRNRGSIPCRCNWFISYNRADRLQAPPTQSICTGISLY